jgi:hypothetical protein
MDALALPAGRTVAVTGATGALGGYQIQLARADGLRLVADAAHADEDLVRTLGADLVVRRGDGVAAASASRWAVSINRRMVGTMGRPNRSENERGSVQLDRLAGNDVYDCFRHVGDVITNALKVMTHEQGVRPTGRQGRILDHPVQDIAKEGSIRGIDAIVKQAHGPC